MLVDEMAPGQWRDVHEDVASRLSRTEESTDSVVSVSPIYHQDASMAHQCCCARATVRAT